MSTVAPDFSSIQDHRLPSGVMPTANRAVGPSVSRSRPPVAISRLAEQIAPGLRACDRRRVRVARRPNGILVALPGSEVKRRERRARSPRPRRRARYPLMMSADAGAIRRESRGKYSAQGRRERRPRPYRSTQRASGRAPACGPARTPACRCRRRQSTTAFSGRRQPGAEDGHGLSPRPRADPDRTPPRTKRSAGTRRRDVRSAHSAHGGPPRTTSPSQS